MKTCPVCGPDVQYADSDRFCPKHGLELRVPINYYDGFISYRRDGGSDTAALIRVMLESNYGKNLFLDVDGLKSGLFDERLLQYIEAAPNFILILTPGSLDRCQNEGDWVGREIEHALLHKKNIIPVFAKGFVPPPVEKLSGKLKELFRYAGIFYDHQNRSASMAKIVEFMVATPEKTEKPPPPPQPPPLVQQQQQQQPKPPPSKKWWQTALAAVGRKRKKIALAVVGACVLAAAGLWYFGVIGPAGGSEKAAAPKAKAEGEKRVVNAANVANTVNTQSLIEGKPWTVPGLNLEMVPIAAGTFQMGDSIGTGNPNEKPVHTVRITKPFWLGKYVVTQGQYEALMGNNPSHFKNVGKNVPVENVSWFDAMEFCRKLTEKEQMEGRLPEGYAYTLPTEAQWEYACRAGTTGDYAGVLDEMGWYQKNSDNQTHPVGQKKANAWGLYDMHGNVWEWCKDWYDEGYYAKSPTDDPTGIFSGSTRVDRGGGYCGVFFFCSSANRGCNPPGRRSDALGFRLALSAVGGEGGKAEATQQAAAQAEQAKPTSGKQPQIGQTMTVPDLNLEMVPIPAGTFQMGSGNGEPNEKPAHTVRITKPFWLGKYQVTQGQWEALMGTSFRQQWDKRGRWTMSGDREGANYPMYCVSQDDAMEFCRKLTEKERTAGRLPEGYVYTLPTEAQWEYACRAGTTGDFAGELDKLGWYDENSGGQMHPVGQKGANAWGLYDMHGNVNEFCRDWYGRDYYAKSPGTDPTGPASPDDNCGCVYRGGNCSSSARECRSACRNDDSGSRDWGERFGFRLALSAVGGK